MRCSAFCGRRVDAGTGLLVRGVASGAVFWYCAAQGAAQRAPMSKVPTTVGERFMGALRQ